LCVQTVIATEFGTLTRQCQLATSCHAVGEI